MAFMVEGKWPFDFYFKDKFGRRSIDIRKRSMFAFEPSYDFYIPGRHWPGCSWYTRNQDYADVNNKKNIFHDRRIFDRNAQWCFEDYWRYLGQSLCLCSPGIRHALLRTVENTNRVALWLPRFMPSGSRSLIHTTSKLRLQRMFHSSSPVSLCWTTKNPRGGEGNSWSVQITYSNSNSFCESSNMCIDICYVPTWIVIIFKLHKIHGQLKFPT